MPNNFLCLMTAGSAPSLPGVPLDGICMRGCHLYHSMDATWIVPIRAGRGTFRLPIPANPFRIGQSVYFQAAAGRSTTRAGHVRIGI